MPNFRGTLPALVWALGLGCNGLFDIHDGAPREALDCSVDADCASLVKEPECLMQPRCIEGRCMFEENTPLGPNRQTTGDCRVVVCGKEGEVRVNQDPADPEDDGNPCTLDECRGYTTEHSPLSFAPCYTGPAGTLGVGRCAAGIMQCKDGEPTTGCLLDVVPAEEACDGTMADEDCDGQANEEGPGCVCGAGAKIPCSYSGPAGTEGVGECHAGVRTCDVLGKSWGPCAGEVTPEAEICDPPGKDEDCNGSVDDALGCTCGNGVVDPGELCDDGNVFSFDECTATCQPAACGDGIIATNESCDDGNTQDGDACPANCKLPVLRIAAGQQSPTCALLRDIGVKCWGNNEIGELGLGDTKHRGDQPGEMGSALPVVDFGTGARPIAIDMGYWHTCVLLEGGSVKCWGYNQYGELGIGDTQNRGGEPGQMGDALPAVDLGAGKHAVKIAAGQDHTCALLQDGSVKCWGSNEYGQLGVGDTNNRGDEPGEMGDALPAVDLGSGEEAVDIEAGGWETCVVLRYGHVKCWGRNYFGKLGLGDDMPRGDGIGVMGDALPALDLGSGKRAAAVNVGLDSACVVLVDGAIKCWGENSNGNLGLGDKKSRGDEAGEMGNMLPALDFGASQKALAVSVGAGSCALLDSFQLKCWGENDFGQLGLGDTMSRGIYPTQMGDALPVVSLGTGKRAVAVSIGISTCAILSDGSVKCWGNNQQGRLGLGDELTRGDEPGEMGDNLPAVSLF